MRMSVAWTTERRSSARVSASRSKPSSRDHSPMYIDGAYCACSAPMRSSARGIGVRARSSRSWRASSARLSSRWLRTRSVTARRRARRATSDPATSASPSARIIWPTRPCGASATRTSWPWARRPFDLAGQPGLDLQAPAAVGAKARRVERGLRVQAIVDHSPHDLEVRLGLHGRAHHTEGAQQAPVAREQPGDDRLKRARPAAIRLGAPPPR